MALRAQIRAIAVALLFASAPVWAADSGKTHHISIQVDGPDTGVMNMVLNNILNIYSYYHARNEVVDIELVAFGPGLAMLRDDISPVKDRIKTMKAEHPGLVLSACENSRRAMSQAEGKEVAILPEAMAVPAGVVRLSELQEQGWTYLRP